MLFNQRHDALAEYRLHNELLYWQPENGIEFLGRTVVPLQEAFDCIKNTHVDLGHVGYKKALKLSAGDIIESASRRYDGRSTALAPMDRCLVLSYSTGFLLFQPVRQIRQAGGNYAA